MTDSKSKKPLPAKKRKKPARKTAASPRTAATAQAGNLHAADFASKPLSPALISLLEGRETKLLMEADNVGVEQLITALTRIPIPRRKR